MVKAPDTILKLVEHFGQNIDSFKGAGYNEAQLRQQFINPFFEALGWDIANKAGTAPAYRDVIHEDAIKIGGTTKAPDYCFRIGATKKFFVEAKKPAVDIKSEISPAYQLRRYAWSAKLPLSILTDFEEFAIYDCQIRPNVNDKPSTARIFYCTYEEYGDKWEQIANIFSKDAVLKGLFDKYASEKTTKRGTTTVDKEILAEIERWRGNLAKNIALRNGNLSVQDLNFAVQKTIDRILFLRICEDRGIERSEQLLGLVNGTQIYPRLFELFEKADERYNSGIFHFSREKDRPEGPDELSANLKIDDGVLKQILKDIYYPHSPYEFSVMPAEILGNVYEQFLGKVIRLTASHQAKVEEKPEVKKAGGVYYTPSYIVDYIVKNTVGRLCEGKTPRQIEKIKILDPACGSGSFLIGAYQYLLDYHRDYYEKKRSKYKKVIYQGRGGQSFLTIDEKKRILLNNIFGVDIDSQAVEVTKLSLLLKVLENETQESLRLFHERALPDLGNNIKCGNSLIGSDFYQNQQLSLFDDEQQRKINAFDWQKEFPKIFKQGGFDCVIGNPPWIFTKYVDWGESTKNYIQERYLTEREEDIRSKARQAGKINLFAIFLLKGLGLLKNNGSLGLILPNNILRTTVYDTVRKKMLQFYKIRQIVDLKSGVFQHVTASTIIILIDSQSHDSHHRIQIVDNAILGAIEKRISNTILQSECLKNTSYTLDIFTNSSSRLLINKMNKLSIHLSTLIDVLNGIATFADMSGILDKYHNANSKPIIFGKNIARYNFIYSGRYVNYVRQELLRPRDESIFLAPEKLVMQRIGGILVTAYDNQQYYTFNSVNNLILKKGNRYSLKYNLGILNSKLMRFYYITKFTNKSSLTVNISKTFLDTLPIRQIDFSKPDEVKDHDQMVTLVDRMLELHKKINTINNPNEKTRIQRQIEATDEQIDKLVYELYSLTEDEKKIIDGKDDKI